MNNEVRDDLRKKIVFVDSEQAAMQERHFAAARDLNVAESATGNQ